MSYLSYHTRGNTSPQGKPKVYLLIDPPNEALAKAIADELLAAVNCAVFFRKERIANESEHLATLSEMNLFVLPITTNFLTGNGEAYTVEFTFAQNAQVPILPLMQESGLDELFNQKCGDLQYLDKNRREPAALPYQEKLEKFLNAILVKDELAAKIRNSFDAYVFLSYRKKDRLHIKELMQLIHENDFCRDVAIWYDEYLTPGENFNETIAEALHNSEIVALAVTPNLVNEKNYVMTVEYPMAKNAHKTILPIELVKTDKKCYNLRK